MPKDLVVDPTSLSTPDYLGTAPIPVRQTQYALQEARNQLGDDSLRSMLADMVLIRQFELMLDAFKRAGTFRGIAYSHKGPAHLSVGQEAAAVGQAVALSVDDHIYGSHRSHGEILAKGLAAIRKMSDTSLDLEIDAYPVRELAATVDAHLPGKDSRDRARNLLIYGLMAEIFARSAGFNRGLSGSMHAFFQPFGIYPNNAIVGGSAPIATGAALEKLIAGAPGITVANVGDGSSSCGPVLESLNFAAMHQLRRFSNAGSGGLPILFFFVNNFYAMGGQPLGETLSLDRIARLGAGFRGDGFHAATIDGNDPLAVFAEVRDRRALLLDGQGPALLDCETYRFSGHSSSDPGVYRTREEVSLWESFDPIRRFAARLEAEGLTEEGTLAELTATTIEGLERVAAVATDLDRSPRLPLLTSPDIMDKVMYTSSEVDLSGTHPVELLQPLEDNDRVKQLARRSRSGIVDGEQLSSFRAVQYRDALFEAILEHASRDDRLVIYGEENREYGGAFGVYRGLTELLPLRHLFNAPISEAAIVGTAVGVALEGGRALIELMYADFIGRAGDEIFNQMAKWRAMSGGIVDIPVVLRISIGSRYGAQHAQDWSGLVAQVPGIQVVYPATPYDAKGLLAAALAGNNPVAFFESQDLYDQTEIFHAEGVPANYYRIPIGTAAIVRSGAHATVVTIGAPLYRAIDAAEALAVEDVEIEVIDARSLVPFDYDMVGRSVARTKRLVFVTDSPHQGCFAGSVAAECALRFSELEVAPSIVASKNWIVPPPELVDAFRPSAFDIAEAVRQAMGR